MEGITDWISVSNRVKDSVVQIYTSSYDVDNKKPYIIPSDKLARGSGFIIYSNKNTILIMTNSHVIFRAKNINVRTLLTNNINLEAEVINICPAKDIGLIRIKENSLYHFKNPPPSVNFEDSRYLDDTTEVLTAGYPLGFDKIKFTKGILSGSHEKYDENYLRNISYLQIDAAINAGSSGGPLFNKHGNVIGITSAALDGIGIQNTSYAIPTYVVSSVLYDLLYMKNNYNIVNIPDLNIKWNNTNIHSIPCNLNKQKKEFGIFIYNVSDNSFCKLKKNDILFRIIMPDFIYKNNLHIIETFPETHEYYPPSNSILNIDNLLTIKSINSFYKQCPKIDINIDNYGFININYTEDKKPHPWTFNRKVTLNELFDYIPNNIDLELHVIRNSKFIKYTCTTNNNIIHGINYQIPIYKPIDWEICLGCCFTPLSLNLIQENTIDRLANDEKQINDISHFTLDEYRKKQWIAISNVFPNTEASKIRIIDYGFNDIDIIKSINNINIHTMNELRNVLNKFKNKKYIIELFSGKKFILSDINSKSRNIDKHIYQKYNIIPVSDFSKKWIS